MQLTTAYYTLNDGFTANDGTFITAKLAVSFQLIVYANNKITNRYYRTSLWVCCQAAKKRKITMGKKFSVKINYK